MEWAYSSVTGVFIRKDREREREQTHKYPVKTQTQRAEGCVRTEAEVGEMPP